MILVIEATDETTQRQHKKFMVRLDGILDGILRKLLVDASTGEVKWAVQAHSMEPEMCVDPCPGNVVTLDETRILLKRLSNHLRRCHFPCFAVLRGRVPIVKFTDPRTGVCVDLSVKNDTPVDKSRLSCAIVPKDNAQEEEEEEVEKEKRETADTATIARFVADTEATDKNRRQMKALRLRLTRLLKKFVGPETQIDPFGSTVSGFATRDSDLDITIDPSPGKVQVMTLNKKRKLLKRLAKHLRRCRFQCFAVLRGRVPIVKLTDPRTGVCVDISVNTPADLSVYTSQLFKEYSSIDHRFRSLVMTVHAWAKARSINSASKGTLASFAYSILVLHTLQQIQPPILPILTTPTLALRGSARERAVAAGQALTLTRGGQTPRFVGDVQVDFHLNSSEGLTGWGSENEFSTAELLAAFFEYFAKFDFDTLVVPTHALEPIGKGESSLHDDQRTDMSVQDPLDLRINLARSVDAPAAKRIGGEFIRAHKVVCQKGLAAVLQELQYTKGT